MAAKKVTLPELRRRKLEGPKLAVVTAYDATFARLLDQAGVDILLVGDSLGMVVQGHRTTLEVTVEEVCYHGRAVARGTARAQVVGDMPFMSYQVSSEQALVNAGKMIKEGAFEAVKLEGGQVVCEQVRKIVEAGIPVMGHVGLTPQSFHAMGGFRVQGKSPEEADRLLHDARCLEQAGAYSIVLEGIPAEVSRRITEMVSIPTIGIGAGAGCDGQVLVCYDLLGMYQEFLPKFVKQYAALGQEVMAATRAFVDEVRKGVFPNASHSFHINPENFAEPSGTSPVVANPPPLEGYGPARDEEPNDDTSG